MGGVRPNSATATARRPLDWTFEEEWDSVPASRRTYPTMASGWSPPPIAGGADSSAAGSPSPKTESSVHSPDYKCPKLVRVNVAAMAAIPDGGDSGGENAAARFAGFVGR